ncbi:phosphatase PAP2 family protein [Streptomyces sp. NBC_01803]|uniref:phosphatase PAP2 family protein n=1 Tax=Streptomyces sp. NBC_01803 TaxID=2975946 RepID=UPI002DDAA1F1|nr:phosphatase PAP2 family protein [Streptomyces sp. NBC_01803]WSA44891.1 phosphatase PAP2 family protein [Streptomyces sp. NBC_01803]
MAGLDQLDNPDVELDVLYDLNGLAERLPGGAESVLVFVGQRGIPAALALLLITAWALLRRRPDAAQAVAGVLWAGLAAGIAHLVNVPIRGFVARPRPVDTYPDLHVLVEGNDGHSFVSDHAGAAMAIAVALFLVHRALGLAVFGLAVLQGFVRVMLGVHYPTDVIGGFALGAAVALLLAPLAMAALTPLVALCARTRGLGWIARRPAADGCPSTPRGQQTPERGLAA